MSSHLPSSPSGSGGPRVTTPSSSSFGSETPYISVLNVPGPRRSSIVAAPELIVSSTKVQPRYNGRIKRWPGLLVLVAVVGASVASIAYFGHKSQVDARERTATTQKYLAEMRRIKDGVDVAGDGNTFVDSDLVVNNPKEYPMAKCQQPNYLSKNGQLVAVAKNGTEVPFQIKGVNWFGMETGAVAPLGLWDNDQNGTSVYAVAQFLQANKFNSVRIPVCITHIIENVSMLKTGLINRQSNRALDLTSYLTLLQSIVKALAYRQISVLISLHTLTPTDVGGLWYSAAISEATYLKAVDTLAATLCGPEFWNVLGIDVKNEPFNGSWGTGDKYDFKAGAELIGARVLRGCPNWLAFVEGVNADHVMDVDGLEVAYPDWYGGGLQKVKQFPVQLTSPHKVVYAPHYYTSAVFPVPYFYDDVVPGVSPVFASYTELTDDKLQRRVDVSMYDMFGFILDTKGPAVLFGEFGGLYATDRHPKLTNQRCTDMTIKNMLKHGYAGGYMWSLNPESAYWYNPATTRGVFTEGLLMDDWRTVNKVFLNALKPMDALPDLKPAVCFLQ
ncbi:Aste57867_12830 [Aphanomyces stellatus]|uniref:Aste57867_12830 protein n=1 Tax=Aphanomyces stellatus TaxID=120398 RepID=A0A485KWM6_9STRA|nr:hypothetical protein As57867_012782 [Aphanomyces stellatus]VFT89677.1 Aste57867_12830 [Aphanomyces stellatus]